MKSRLFATLLTLALLLSLVACAEKKPTKYAKNDFANLLTTDFWSMTESDLDAFLTTHRWKSLPDSEGRYLGTFMKETAVLCATYNAEGKVTALTVEQMFYNEAANDYVQKTLTLPAGSVEQKLLGTPAGGWEKEQFRYAQLQEDNAGQFARFFLSARQLLTDYRAELDGETGMRLHGDTEETLTAFFRGAVDLHRGVLEYAYSDFEYTAPAQEGPYLLSNGAAAELATQVTYRLDEPTDPIKEFSSRMLRLYAPDYLNPQPSEPESDVWAAYREYPVEDVQLPEWLYEANSTELLHYCCEHTLRSVLPEEHIVSLVDALPRWMYLPREPNTVSYDGGDSWELRFYKDGTYLDSVWVQTFCSQIRISDNKESAQYFYIKGTPDLQAISDLGVLRHQLPKPASMQITSPDGQTVQVSPAEAAALAMQFNDALFHASDAYWPNVKDKWKDGDHWTLRVTGKDGAEKQITLDCYTSVSIYYPFSQVKDELGLAAFSMPKEQMDALKELLQSYMEP